MSDALVGGVVALAGTVIGFLGALGIRSLDIRRQEAEARGQLMGYINTVIAELAMNHTILSHVVENKSNEGELTVSDSAYRAAELALARDLSWKAQEEVYKAYAPIRAGHLYAWIFVRTGASFEVQSYRQIDLEACADQLPQLERAAAALRQERDRLTGSRFRKLRI
ncbi:MAG TPA: hypothetical protein VND96_01750 [Candidatus Micrarchaeaceae archaeon]|nr:hypothetical protein [Candidatus Micrarchaeaceae archaeon]